MTLGQCRMARRVRETHHPHGPRCVSRTLRSTYDIQGEVASMTHQNLTTHTYTYDNLGREIADSVTLPTLGGVYNPSNIDTAVMEIGLRL